MDKQPVDMLVSLFRCGRLILHLIYGIVLAIFYPYISQTRQRHTLQTWSRKLLIIMNIGIQIEGYQPNCEDGCLIVANHVSWLDIFVLNAIQPLRFVAKSEVRGWPVIGWLSQRSGTIFIERSLRQDTAKTNQNISLLLKQGASIGLFPEGTTTDGQHVGHFHSSLLQPAIDAGARLYPIALRYQDEAGKLSSAAAFIGETTIVQSIWKLLRCPHLNTLVMFTPVLQDANVNRRVLARTAQTAIAQGLQDFGSTGQIDVLQAASAVPQTLLSSQSVYSLLIDPMLKKFSK